MAQILLVGEDWKTRALLRAQLLEEGLDVEAHESVGAALGDSEDPALLPLLLVADVSASGNPARELDQLARWNKRIPVWVIASRSVIDEKSLQGRGFEAVLFRPVDLGKLVEQIKQRIARTNS